MAKFELTDDGTMDTVVRCTHCGEEMRFTYDPDDPDGIEEDEDAATAAYDAFVEECIETAEDEHECESAEDEPQDEDITTDDYQTFYYCGRCIVEVGEDEDWRKAVAGWCKANNYYPNVWAISDPGNAILISVSDDGRYLSGKTDE